MTLLTLGQAAKLTGLGKSTLARAIKAGRLSAAGRTEVGGYQIDAAELTRVYRAAPPAATVPLTQNATPTATLALLESQIEGLQQVAALLREHNADLSKERDAWRDQAQRLTLPPPAQRPWWRRLVG